MLITMLKSKLHGARVTGLALQYEGSLTVASDLMTHAGFLPYEKILVVNRTNGARFETYVIPGEAGTGGVCVNGGAARLSHVGDELIVMSFAQLSAEEAGSFTPVVVCLDAANHPVAQEPALP
jgi:aspartate 1-decarboxylase